MVRISFVACAETGECNLENRSITHNLCIAIILIHAVCRRPYNLYCVGGDVNPHLRSLTLGCKRTPTIWC